MKKRILKSAILVLLISFLLTTITYSYLSDTITSTGNTLSAGTLMFQTLNKKGTIQKSELFNIQDAKSDKKYGRKLMIKNTGSLDFDYSISVATASGDMNLCNALVLKSKLGTNTYSDNFNDFYLTNLNLSSGDNSIFTFSTKIPSQDEYKGKTCNFTIRVRATQEGTNGAYGFSYTKDLTNTISVEKIQPSLKLSLDEGSKNVPSILHITVNNVSDYKKVSFSYTYQHGNTSEGGQGSQDLTGDNDFSRDLILGYQSGNDWVYYTGINHVEVTVTLTDSNGNTKVLSGHLIP